MDGFLARLHRFLALLKHLPPRSLILMMAKRRAIPDALGVCATLRGTDGSIRGGGARMIILWKRRTSHCRG